LTDVRSVMLVDDVALERRLMRRVIERSGRFEVTAEAGDGRTAVAMVAEVAPDLILLDLSMPDMDGLEALPLLLDASPGTKVLVLSGFSAFQAAEPALQAGAHGYMEKGLHPDEIVARMEVLLDGPQAAPGPGAVGSPESAVLLRAEAARLAAALRDSEELLRQGQEHSSIGMALVSPEGAWLTVNPALCLIVGRSKDELLRTRIQDIVHPEDLEVGREDIQRLMTGEVDTHTAESRYLHADGHVVWVQVNASLIRRADGDPRHFIVQVQDITERKRSQTVLDLLFNSSPDLLCILGTEGRFVRVNPSWTEVLGWSAEELTSRPFADFVHPDDLVATAAEYDGIVGSSDGSMQFENRYRTVTGAYRWLEWNTSPMAEDGLIIANARDMTSHKEREATLEKQREELTRSNADLERFAYVASHDLSEPLRIISGFVGLLETDLDVGADDEVREYMRFIQEGTARMYTLIGDLLAYSRAGRSDAARQPTDLGEVFAEVTSLLALAITEAGATVEIGPLPVITAHRALLLQLAQNLVANAVKFRAAGRAPRVVVSASEAGPGWWALRVEDNGIGVEPELRERMFLMFERLNSRDDYAGNGLGLAICHRIVESHGGTIAAEASDLGGVAIVVTLPDLQETA
jgi:PAS domain S-box-containing protein